MYLPQSQNIVVPITKYNFLNKFNKNIFEYWRKDLLTSKNNGQRSLCFWRFIFPPSIFRDQIHFDRIQIRFYLWRFVLLLFAGTTCPLSFCWPPTLRTLNSEKETSLDRTGKTLRLENLSPGKPCDSKILQHKFQTRKPQITRAHLIHSLFWMSVFQTSSNDMF